MKLEEINLRDPFIFPHEGIYYLTGTRAVTCWGEADGFDGYRSRDLKEWEGPFEIFDRPEGFRADRNYWAPEIHAYRGNFYLFATFGYRTDSQDESTHKKGTHILRADHPLGPYSLWSKGSVTPEAWNCLDGTFYSAPDGTPYMVFSHEWEDLGDGQICAVRLSADLRRAEGLPFTLFSASQAQPWVKSITHRRWDGPVYVTDGPFLYRKSFSELLLLWATFGAGGYAEGLARSDNGEITGHWTVDETPLFDRDGGHGMVFRTFEGDLQLVLHQPNETPKEHPVLIPIAL